MPSQSSKSPQTPSTKTQSFFRKSTDESPSFKTTSTSVPSEVRTSQSTNSLSPRSSESNHPEEDDVISDDEKNPEVRAAAELRANRRRGYDPNSSLDENSTSFLSGVGSSCHDIGITLTAQASPEVDQEVLLFRAALVSVATLYMMKADATIRINRSLFKFTYWLQCNTFAVKMYLVLQ